MDMSLIYFNRYPKIPVIHAGYFVCSACLKMYLSLGACISNRMDLEGGVNCTHLLNVFLEIVNTLNFGELNSS